MKKYNAYESRFSAHNYHGYPHKGQSYIYKEGTVPILLSVPHSVYHVREGQLKKPECYTGTIALLLQTHTNVHTFTKCFTDEDDPNYNLHSPYRNQLEEIVHQHKIALVLDVHGAKKERPFAIDIGTNHGKTASRDTIEAFKTAFVPSSQSPFIVTENHTFAAGGNTVTNFLHQKTGVETMQIEINQHYRSPQEDFEAFITLLRHFTRFIEQQKSSQTRHL